MTKDKIASQQADDDDNDDTLYDMPPFEGRNILIFSDGTGQASGLLFDESRTNVYKLFRATRCGPDSSIDPDRQIAFYDAGLGSKLNASKIRIGIVRRLYNWVSSATGLGITQNVIDCYAALLMLWRPGDRIFLFGFSRGAYTVRCLGGVLGLCGLPQVMPDKSPLLRNPKALEEIATEAVKRVYSHGSGAGEDRNVSEAKRQRLVKRKNRLEVQRKALAAQFQEKYGSANVGKFSAIPHFIGVWDTVAAVGLSPPAWRGLKIAVALLVFAISASLSWYFLHDCSLYAVGVALASSIVLAGAIWLVSILLRFKSARDLPEHPWHTTWHLTPFKMKFFDRFLNAKVRYARHALAIDENRQDFDRVPWVNDGDPPNRKIAEGPWFRQFWFAGNHSDIGGSYPENESRLSDISLKWMANQAKKAGLLVDPRYLQLYGRHDGPQHDECRVGISILGMHFAWREHTRRMVDNATIHPSVMRRFRGGKVLVYDTEQDYRPELLTKHIDFKTLHEKPLAPVTLQNPTEPEVPVAQNRSTAAS